MTTSGTNAPNNAFNGSESDLPTRPLDGARVVEFGQLIAGPGTAAMLGELGAEVIKVESPAGDSARSTGRFGAAIFAAFNQGKRSVIADLDTDDGRNLARELCRTADVVVENYRHGSLAKRGLGWDDLHQLNDRLVYASASGFPSHTDEARRPAFDVVAQAESGMMSIVGEHDGQPLKVGFTVVDVATTYALVNGVLAALLQRDKTGRGSRVEVSLVEVATHLQAQVWVEYLATGDVPTRFGNGHPDAAPAGDLVAVSDGHIVISAYTDAHWRRLCEVLQRPKLARDERFATNQSRAANRAALLAMLEEALGEFTREGAARHLADAGVVAGAVFTYPEALVASETVGRDTFETIPDPAGEARAPRTPVRTTGWTSPPKMPAPALGEATESIRAELGLVRPEPTMTTPINPNPGATR